MKTFDIPESYRITEADNDEAWKITADGFTKDDACTDEQHTIISAFIKAGEMKHKNGAWPTLGEVYEQWGAENEEQERLKEEREKKHDALMKVWNGQRVAKQKV
jgi:hypothetical protein